MIELRDGVNAVSPEQTKAMPVDPVPLARAAYEQMRTSFKCGDLSFDELDKFARNGWIAIASAVVRAM